MAAWKLITADTCKLWQAHSWECHWKGMLLQQGWIPIYVFMVILISPHQIFFLGWWADQRLLSPCMPHLKTYSPVYGDNSSCLQFGIFLMHVKHPHEHWCRSLVRHVWILIQIPHLKFITVKKLFRIASSSICIKGCT